MDQLVELMTQYKTILLVSSLAAMWFLEHWLPFFEGEEFENSIPHDARNLTLAFINFLVIAVAFAWITRLATSWSAENNFGLLRLGELAPAMQIFLAVLLMDVWIYFWHRGTHYIQFLWRFHRVHHSDPAMDASSGLRFHFGEVVLSAVTRAGVLLVFGLDLWMVVLYEALMTPLVILHHSNANLGKLDDWMRLVFISPNMHRIHHSRYQPETDSNFGVIFSLWDRMFGTYNGRKDVENIRLGLDEFDDKKWQTLPGMLKTPVRNL